MHRLMRARGSLTITYGTWGGQGSGVRKARSLEKDAKLQQGLADQIRLQKAENEADVAAAFASFAQAISLGGRGLEIYKVRAYINYERQSYDAEEDINKGRLWPRKTWRY